MERRVIEISERVRIIEASSSDGTWYTIEWEQSPAKPWFTVDLPETATFEHAEQIASGFVHALQEPIATG